MKILFSRFNLSLQKLDLGYTHFADLGGFYDYVVVKNWQRSLSESYSSRPVTEIALQEILAHETDMTGNYGQIIKGKNALAPGYQTAKRTLLQALGGNWANTLDARDQLILSDSEQFVTTAQQRTESTDLKILAASGGFTLVPASGGTDLYFNNALAGTFIPKRANCQDYHMNTAGDELDMATDEVLLPLKPAGSKYGDELYFHGNDTGAIDFPDKELYHSTPAAALKALVQTSDYCIDRHHLRRAGPEVVRELSSI